MGTVRYNLADRFVCQKGHTNASERLRINDIIVVKTGAAKLDS